MTRLGLAVFFSMNVMVFTFALWAYDTHGMQDQTSSIAASFADLLRFICLIMSLPVLALLGTPLARHAGQQLRRGNLSTDLLLMTGVVAAYAYSAVSVWRGSGPLYLEVGCTILVFVTLGRWLEATGKLRSTQALDQLQRLLPAEVSRMDASGTAQTIPLECVAVGDELRIRAGERIPADGILTSPQALVDEQLITGECWPVTKTAGEALVGGTLNLDTDALLKVTATPQAGTLARLVQAVREARLRAGKYQILADRVSSWFFPVIALIALTTFGAHTARSGLGTGLLAAMSVVLIACPCALGLATPLAVWSALGAAARRGVVIQSGDVLEKLATARALRFDKTGTLTTGEATVNLLVVDLESDRSEVLARARTLADASRHVFSQAIVDFAGKRRSAFSGCWETIQTRPGRGIFACGHGEREPTALGNRRLMQELGLELPGRLSLILGELESQGQPVALLGWGGRVRAVFAFHEELRPQAAGILADCWNKGLDVEILTGDHPGRGAWISQQLDVLVQAGLTPDGKVRAIQDARQRFGPVIMVGDGINDVAACAEADIGVAMGCGADVTRESASVCLISNDLQQIPWLLDLAQRTARTIRRNLFWAFGYNTVGVIAASLGWLHPSLAAVLMVASSLLVISNSLRLADDDTAARLPDEELTRLEQHVHAQELSGLSAVEGAVGTVRFGS